MPKMILNSFRFFFFTFKPCFKSIINTVFLIQIRMYADWNFIGRIIPFSSYSVPSLNSVSVLMSHLFPIPNSIYLKKKHLLLCVWFLKSEDYWCYPYEMSAHLGIGIRSRASNCDTEARRQLRGYFMIIATFNLYLPLYIGVPLLEQLNIGLSRREYYPYCGSCSSVPMNNQSIHGFHIMGGIYEQGI